MEYEKLITRLRHIYADGDPITEEAADCIEQLSGITEQLRQRVAELEKFHELDTKQIAYLFEERNNLTAERDALKLERDKATQYWQIAEGRCDALMKQRADLLAALINHQDQTRPIQQTIDAIASVKEKS